LALCVVTGDLIMWGGEELREKKDAWVFCFDMFHFYSDLCRKVVHFD